jgi:phosphate butyryltransferase
MATAIPEEQGRRKTMSLTTFSDIEQMARVRCGDGAKKRVVVAAAHDSHTLEGLEMACEKGLIAPVLIGDRRRIEAMIADTHISREAVIIDECDESLAARQAVRMVASGDGDILMKGRLQTSDLLREVVDKSFDLVEGELLSHIGLFQIPTYHKLLMLTDGGMVIAPDVEKKRQIINNAVKIAKLLGVEHPKIACLCATEVESKSMQGSVDAAQLKQWNEKGIIPDCIVEGPISFDLMYDQGAASIKGYESPVAGDADICLMPDMTAGNLVAKSLMCAAGAMMVGLIVGAKLPIVLVSRGATSDEKYWSTVFASAIA